MHQITTVEMSSVASVIFHASALLVSPCSFILLAWGCSYHQGIFKAFSIRESTVGVDASIVAVCCLGGTPMDTYSIKLQALVYNILPSTTAIFSYTIGSRKLSANEQFFVVVLKQ